MFECCFDKIIVKKAFSILGNVGLYHHTLYKVKKVKNLKGSLCFSFKFQNYGTGLKFIVKIKITLLLSFFI